MVVLGLSQTEDIRAVKTALGAAGLSLEALDTVGPGDGDANLVADRAPSGIITSGGGTGVPGINSSSASRGIDVDELSDRLGDFGVPDSELDNLLEAVERGKTIVAYHATADNADRVTAAFDSANLSNVRRF